MAKHDPVVSLNQMRDAAREAIELAKDRTAASFHRDRILTLALTHLLEILGEAARRIPIPFQSAHSQVPWASIIGMRNRLIHAYDQVEPDKLWATIRDDLPPLVKQLDSILGDKP